jgi:uncharacterized protein
MRVLADTNLFISYLLHPGTQDKPIHRFFTALADGVFTLLMPQDLLNEIVMTVSAKPYLSARIPPADLAAFAALLTAMSEEIPVIEQPLPRLCRDPKDDFLLAYALVGQADYLVTGDQDLLELGSVDAMRIVTPAGFIGLIASR